MSIPSMSGLFPNSIHENDIIIDPSLKEPNESTQEELRSEIEDFEDLIALDYKYCVMVEGVSQETNLWVPRNQNETGLVDTDLQKFKNITWNECVVRKFLTSEKGNVDFMGRSMINIIQTLNLQWKNLHVMGLHPKIEAAEKQVVMRCFEESLLPYHINVGKLARSLRRCNHFSDFFANVVGSFVCHNTGRTPGLSKTMYGSDIDFAYKEKNYLHFANALKRNKETLDQCLRGSDHVDYIARLTQFKVIKKPDQRVDLQDYDTGKCQQPMYLGQTNSNVDVRDIIHLVESKMRQITDRVVVNFSGERSQLETTINIITSEAERFTDLMRETDVLGMMTTLIYLHENIQLMLDHIDQMWPSLRDPTAPIPAPFVPRPRPTIVDNFISRVTAAPGPVANEMVFDTQVSLPFSRKIRQRTGTIQPLIPSGNPDNTLNAL